MQACCQCWALLSDLLGPEFEAAGAATADEGLHDVNELYRCTRRTLVRDGFESFSPVVGALEPGPRANCDGPRRSIGAEAAGWPPREVPTPLGGGCSPL